MLHALEQTTNAVSFPVRPVSLFASFSRLQCHCRCALANNTANDCDGSIVTSVYCSQPHSLYIYIYCLSNCDKMQLTFGSADSVIFPLVCFPSDTPFSEKLNSVLLTSSVYRKTQTPLGLAVVLNAGHAFFSPLLNANDS